MKSVTNLCIAVLGIALAVGVGLYPANGQAPPKTSTKTGPPPKTPPNQGNQTVTLPKGQPNSGDRTGPQSKSQTKPNMISSAEMEHMQQLGSQLGLNENQFSQIVTIVNTAHLRDKALDDDTALTPAQKHAKLQSIQRIKNAQIDAILTPAERTKLQQIVKGG